MPHKLLLADDSVTIQRVIELTFADQDVEVLTAGDGEQAIFRIQTDRPDIVLADIGMPKRSGYDVAAFVKSSEELRHIPVLLLTGAFEPVDEGRAQQTGCDGVLVKPFEPQHVIARVHELLRGAKGSPGRAVANVPRPVERLTPSRAADVPRREATAGAFDQVARPPADDSLDAYFDRLDAAFASAAGPNDPPSGSAPVKSELPADPNLEWFHTPQPAPAAAPAPAPVIERGRFEAAQEELRAQLAAAKAQEEWTQATPATFASPPPAVVPWPTPPAPVEREEVAESTPEPAAPPFAPAEPASAPQTPREADVAVTSSVAEAFSALLAVEQGEPGAVAPRLAPSRDGGGITDDVIEEIARRVVARLAPTAVRDVVADVVSDVAERLVRDEIDRIRRQAQ